MIKILTPATEEEVAVIVAVVESLNAEKKEKPEKEVFNWQVYSKRARHEPVVWENKKNNSLWALESRLT